MLTPCVSVPSAMVIVFERALGESEKRAGGLFILIGV